MIHALGAHYSYSEMPLGLQAKLLRVLQEREVERVGGRKAIPLDIRVIATSNRDMAEHVAKGDFREDLYYRLNVVNINIPPLRDRKEDIPGLAEHFLAKFSGETGKKVEGIEPAAMDMLTRYDWPGNVRELENIIERAVVLEKGETVTASSLPLSLRHEAEDADIVKLPEGGGTLTDVLEELERQLIVKALKDKGGSQTAAAAALGLKRSTLRYKLEKYGLVSAELSE